jgi:hypothetical protein
MSLQEHLESVIDVDVEAEIELRESEARGRFVVADESEALWAVRKLRRLTDDLESKRAEAAQERERIDEWLQDAERSLDRQISFFESLLVEYHQARFVADGEKSIKLPGATLKSTAGQPTWEFEDETFIAWATDAHPELVRTKQEVNKAEAKKVLTLNEGKAVDPDTGEVVAGVTVEPAVRSFKVVLS